MRQRQGAVEPWERKMVTLIGGITQDLEKRGLSRWPLATLERCWHATRWDKLSPVEKGALIEPVSIVRSAQCL